MTTDPVTLPLHASAKDALQLTDSKGVHHLLVTDRTRVMGVMCRCDLLDASPETPAIELLRSPFVFVSSSATVEDAARLVLQQGIGCLPVLDPHGRLVGVVTRRDLRRVGALPGELGVDRCATCGDSHSLARVPSDGGPAFCGTCRARAHPHFDDEEPSTLGGFG